MKSLRSRVLDEATLLQTEVLWASYEQQPEAALREGVLRELAVAPGFSLYLGVDGHELFAPGPDLGDTPAPAKAAAPFGYSRVPKEVSAAAYDPAPFAEGRPPGWQDAQAGRWPVLGSGRALEAKLLKRLEGGDAGGVVAIGPLGEGKSLAVRQVATAVAASRPDWNVLWREHGAPALTDAWLRQVQSGAAQTLICSDEADLFADQLVSTQEIWGAEGSGLAFLLASHDRLWWQQGGNYLRRSFTDVLFHGITVDDARNISEAWQYMGLLPASAEGGQNVTEVADRLATSAGVIATETNTLFGAVLDVRYGQQLGSRVELVEKLRDIELTDEVSVGDVFAGICVMQQALDKDGNRGKGASRPVIAAMAGLGEVFADGKILRTLGREAAVTFAGNRVYSRHPSIASAVVMYLHRQGIAEKIYTLVGKAGGVLRVAGARDEDGFRDAYLLTHELASKEAIWAAAGAVAGTAGLLEPRVTLLSALRREGGSRPEAYARGLAPRLHDYRDFHGAVRAYLVDFSITMRMESHAQTAVGLSALALDDRVGLTLDKERAGYALVSMVKSSIKLEEQTSGGAISEVAEIACVLLELIRGRTESARYLRSFHSSLKGLEEIRSVKPAKLTGRLSPLLENTARSALQETSVALDLDGPLSFEGLYRLAERATARRSGTGGRFGAPSA